MEKAKYDVFISYSRKDYVDDQKKVIPGNVVSKIKEALTKASITYWFDEEGIYSGDTFTEKIVTNIEAANIFVFLSSANSNASSWTSKEIASADEFHKRIIPVRIDKTPYNKKVMFRIADLDFIEYYINPDKGIDDLIRSINAFKEQMAEEERKKREAEEAKREAERQRQENERIKKEQEERRRKEEQQQLVETIKLQCAKLNNEETRIDIDRNNLLLDTAKVTDKDQQAVLKQLIVTSSPFHKKAQDESAKLIKQLEELEKEVAENKQNNNSQELAQLKKDLAETKQLLEQAKQKEAKATQQADEAQAKADKAAQETAKLTATNKEQVKTIDQLQDEIVETQAQLTKAQKENVSQLDEIASLKKTVEKNRQGKSNKKLHIIYGSIIAALAIICLMVSGGSTPSNDGIDDINSAENDTIDIKKGDVSVKVVVNVEHKNPVLGDYTYSGEVDENNLPTGHGKAVFKNGDTFEGTFDKGNVVNGKYTWSDGSSWEGKFVNNEPDN